MAPTPVPYVVLDGDGVAVNVVLWDGVTAWHPGEGLRAVPQAEHLAARDVAQDDG